MELWIASFNKNKFREIKDIFANCPFELHGAFELPTYMEPNEDGMTFGANARIKAKSLQAVKPGTWILSDDSGIEVDVLDGLPGVHSARYAGPKARDVENTTKLLKQVQLRSGGENRKAQFRCVMCLLDPNGKEHIFEGTLKGELARDMRGTQGFGYDPIFIPEGETKTLGELGKIVKNKYSHRARALEQVEEFLKTQS